MYFFLHVAAGDYILYWQVSTYNCMNVDRQIWNVLFDTQRDSGINATCT